MGNDGSNQSNVLHEVQQARVNRHLGLRLCILWCVLFEEVACIRINILPVLDDALDWIRKSRIFWQIWLHFIHHLLQIGNRKLGLLRCSTLGEADRSEKHRCGSDRHPFHIQIH